ncbi:MAG: hypothetical protein JRG79_01685 [Deltaproteobacteria bacterium]|nr:hypothetical protein [Deltaproteobacteria bacterium]MBW1941636.1 hypothetical protein [Deltaproteobacteria bacterium]MBW2205593.1 hypothetical protein [Deltaproteobacteria bacterium]
MKTVELNFGRRSTINRRLMVDEFIENDRRKDSDRRGGYDRRSFTFRTGKCKEKERRVWLMEVP